MIDQLGIGIEAVRVGYFRSGNYERHPDPSPDAVQWAGVWLKPKGKRWQAVWTETARAGDDAAQAITRAIGLGRNLSVALGVTLILPES
jgi:hypothetical protein